MNYCSSCGHKLEKLSTACPNCNSKIRPSVYEKTKPDFKYSKNIASIVLALVSLIYCLLVFKTMFDYKEVSSIAGAIGYAIYVILVQGFLATIALILALSEKKDNNHVLSMIGLILSLITIGFCIIQFVMTLVTNI